MHNLVAGLGIRFPVGSSASTIDGLVIRALPIDVRCCCPPEARLADEVRLSVSPRRKSMSSICAFSTFLPSSSIRIAMFSSTFNIGIRL